MRKQKAEHPPWMRDLSVVHSAGTGRKIRTDKNGTVSKLNEQAEPVCRKRQSDLQCQQKNLLDGYIKVLLVTFVSIVYLNAAQT